MLVEALDALELRGLDDCAKVIATAGLVDDLNAGPRQGRSNHLFKLAKVGHGLRW